MADATLGPHCLALSMLLECCIAQSTNWDARVDLYVAAFLILLRSVILTECLADKSTGVYKAAVFMVILALNFGTSCSSLFLFGVSALSSAITLLGLSLGLWAIVKKTGHGAALPLICLAGIGCGSFGPLPSVATWSVYLLACLLMQIKSRSLYVMLGAGALTNFLLLWSMHLRSSSTAGALSPFFFVKYENIIGRCFANGIGQSTQPLPQSGLTGAVGLVLLILLLLFHIRQRTSTVRLASALALISYALLGTAAVAISRDSIASWYTQYAVLFWTGLLALAGLLLRVTPPAERILSKYSLPIVLASLTVIFASYAYLTTNIGTRDKDYFCRTHSPSAESFHAAFPYRANL